MIKITQNYLILENGDKLSHSDYQFYQSIFYWGLDGVLHCRKNSTGKLDLVVVGNGYRLLRANESVKPGDEFLDNFGGRWCPTGYSYVTSFTVGDIGNLYRRKIEYTTITTNLNSLAAEVYNNNVEKGFHSPENSALNTSIPIFVANIHGEVSELWEAYRKNELFEPCDKNIDLNCFGEELADIVLRVLDTAHENGIDIDTAIGKKHNYNLTRPHKHGGKVC